MTKESEIKEVATSQEAHLKSSKGDLSEGSADHSVKDHDTRSDDSAQPQENQDLTVIARQVQLTQCYFFDFQHLKQTLFLVQLKHILWLTQVIFLS